MPENYYDDSQTSGTATEPAADNAQATSVLPKDFFQGKELEPGTRCEIEIVRVHDQDVEVSYVPHESSEEEASESEQEMGPPEGAPMAEQGMSSMME